MSPGTYIYFSNKTSVLSVCCLQFMLSLFLFVFPLPCALCPEIPGIGSRLTMTLYRISRMENKWMDRLWTEEFVCQHWNECYREVIGFCFVDINVFFNVVVTIQNDSYCRLLKQFLTFINLPPYTLKLLITLLTVETLAYIRHIALKMSLHE